MKITDIFEPDGFRIPSEGFPRLDHVCYGAKGESKNQMSSTSLPWGYNATVEDARAQMTLFARERVWQPAGSDAASQTNAEKYDGEWVIIKIEDVGDERVSTVVERGLSLS